MKTFLLSCFLTCIGNCSTYAQEWTSISRSSSYKYEPFMQFAVNPYTNDLWFAEYLRVSTINEQGQITLYGEAELGDLWYGYNIKFAFTESQVYFCKNYYGMYRLNGTNPELLYQYPLTDNTFEAFTNNKDTIYIVSSDPYVKYVNGQFIPNIYHASNVFSKNSFFYFSSYINGTLKKRIGPGLSDTEKYADVDNEYFCDQFNDVKFSRKTDSIYVACNRGITYGYNYDFLDTISPFNTINMPTANVLEMEFDKLDRLWAVFGDANNQAYALAMLENDTWVNYYDANNSPIVFENSLGTNTFWGIEIDTLGNVWVCDSYNLHTLLCPTTPQWILNTPEKEKPSFEIYPNPTEDQFTINFAANTERCKVSLLDLNGNVLSSWETNEQKLNLSLEKFSSGMYYIQVENAFVKVVKN